MTDTTETETTTITFRLPVTLKRQIEERAAEDERDVSKLIRNAVKMELCSAQPQSSRRTRR